MMKIKILSRSCAIDLQQMHALMGLMVWVRREKKKRQMDWKRPLRGEFLYNDDNEREGKRGVSFEKLCGRGKRGVSFGKLCSWRRVKVKTANYLITLLIEKEPPNLTSFIYIKKLFSCLNFPIRRWTKLI